MKSSSRISKPSSLAPATAGLTSAICILAAGDQAEAARAPSACGSLWPEAAFAVGVHPASGASMRGPAGAGRIVDSRGRLSRARVRRGRNRPGLPLRLLAARRPAGSLCRAACTARARCDLPVVIHTREADEDTFAMLATDGAGIRGVFHCFTGGVDRARRALDLGFHLSLAGIVTFPKATDLHDVGGVCPRGSAPDRDRQPVSGPGAVPREAQRAGLGGPRRRPAGRAARRISRAAVVEHTTRERPATLRHTSSCAR